MQLRLPRRVLQNLLQQMVDLQACSPRRIALGSLDSRDLELKKELGDFDRQIPVDASDASFGGDVDVQLSLELCEVGGTKWCRSRESAQGKLQWGLGRGGKVDGREGDAIRGYIGDVG